MIKKFSKLIFFRLNRVCLKHNKKSPNEFVKTIPTKFTNVIFSSLRHMNQSFNKVILTFTKYFYNFLF